MRISAVGAVVAAAAGFVGAVLGQSTFEPTRPPAIPLAVKSPYLSAWLAAGREGGNGGYLPGQWATFYTGQIVAWTGLVRVDGKTYTWLGAPMVNESQLANQTAFEYTASKSIFTIEVGGKVEITASFVSPLAPKDYSVQSVVASYLDVEVRSLDGDDHDVQLYTDISAEWVSGDLGAVAQWEYDANDEISYHKVWKQDQQPFNEIGDRAEWGNIFYATDSTDGLTYQSGADVDVRGAFVSKGSLASTKDENFRPINQDWPVFGFAVDMGSVTDKKPIATQFSIGLFQEEAIQFDGKDGNVTLPSLWVDYYQDDVKALQSFHTSHDEILNITSSFDSKVAQDSNNTAGKDYTILTTLAARQVMGATQLVGTQDKHYLFLKEISSNGNTQTIDVIYPAAPFFYYANPDLLKLLLDPHFENQEAGRYPNKWAIHDLGTHYPNATGHEAGDDEPMPLEECGNNIIMVLKYAQSANDTAYLTAHYPILKQWVEYLVQDSLYPSLQLSTDDFAGHLENQTNLALKGIIGIAAMSQISTLVGESADAANFSSIAKEYVAKWETLGLGANTTTSSSSLPHTSLTYNNASTHGLLYNLFNDRLVGTNIVPQRVYDQQSAFYLSIADDFGVPLDTRNRYWTKGDWEIFCAAVAGAETRDMFVSRYARFVGETSSANPMSDLYDTGSGRQVEGINFRARPVVGGVFALMVV